MEGRSEGVKEGRSEGIISVVINVQMSLLSMGRELIKSYKDLKVYQMVFDSAMEIFYLSKKFPVEESILL